MKTLIIVRQTLIESITRPTLLIYFAIATLIIIGILAGVRTEYTDGAPDRMFLFGSEIAAEFEYVDPSALIYLFTIGGSLVGIMLLGMFATASIIPSFLKRGTIDIYLSKPISRLQLLFAKYLGGVSSIAAAMLYFYLGMFVVVGLVTGIWNTAVLYAWLLAVLFFGAVYAFASFWAVISRSSGVVLIFVYLHLFILSDIIEHHKEIPTTVFQNRIAEFILTVLHYALPQVQAMIAQVLLLFERQLAPEHLIQHEFTIMPFVYSLLSGVLFLLLAYVRFQRSDY